MTDIVFDFISNSSLPPHLPPSISPVQFQGFCWWSIPGAPKDKECEPHKLPGPVTTCPWIGWDREFIPITGTETITWDFETPGRFGIGDVTVTKKPGHASKIYCVCDPSIENCQKTCAEIN